MPTDGRDSRSDSPQVLSVEVTAAAPESSVGGVGRRRVVRALGGLGALAAIMAVWLSGGGARHRDPVTARGPNGVAAAYGYPLGCLRVKILGTNRTYARADLSHAAGCGRITGYAPAIFHYVAGRWRLVPDAVGYMCFRDAVPPAVERGFALCVEPIGHGCTRIGIPGQGRPAAPLGWPCTKLPEIAGVV